MNFFHPGARGDVIYALVAIRALGGGTAWLPALTMAHAQPVPSDLRFREVLRPLLERQAYIHGVEAAEQAKDVPKEAGEGPIDFSNWSRTNNLVQSQCVHAGAMFPGFDPWLVAEPTNPFGEPFVLVNRTHRYQGRLDWAKILDAEPLRKAFIGHRDEHASFESKFGAIDYLEAEGLWQMACLIAACERLYCNPSCALAIAQGLGRPYSLENVYGQVAMGTSNETLLD